MRSVRSLLAVVLNLIGELWISPFRRNGYYDKHTAHLSKPAYAVFLLAVLLSLIGAALLYAP
ncbi:hypothetical protein NDS46_19675 [Paenibacillus thiaminolyticus]|uniref:hypothetical protein n=1 Tax=Paenibacillus thiaminolyticus TaxID=49283 RepID=UPI00232EBEFF|nr:hypothetical protein [Paenibacillus thiaminolyticus]WCF06562.1 hypothetical protein NDS46_19675 [Paenibacillus thiaminolyticus]WII35903.1 hypothetical protein O0V01_19730 [Paenibacillus thiaminolyticus]